jgi:hypothetical protein
LDKYVRWIYLPCNLGSDVELVQSYSAGLPLGCRLNPLVLYRPDDRCFQNLDHPHLAFTTPLNSDVLRQIPSLPLPQLIMTLRRRAA